MPLAILLVALATIGGIAATYWTDDVALGERLPAGLTIGMVLPAIGGFVGSLAGGIDTAVAGATLLAALPLLTLMRSSRRSRLAGDLGSIRAGFVALVTRPDPAGVLSLGLGLVTIVFLWLVFGRVMPEHDGGIYTGYVNNLGDLPFHLQVISSFAFGHNFPVQDPGYLGASFAYPYLSDLGAAILVRLGASFGEALFIQNLVLGVALVGMLHALTRLVTRDRVAALIAPALVLFSGGLGFITLLGDARKAETGILSVLGALTHDATITGDGPYRWGNAITTLLVTQRGLLLGLPVALLVLMLLWKLIATPSGTAPARARRLALAAGILTGCLPLIHAHSYMVVLGTAFFLGLLFRQWRDGRWAPWAIYVLAALLIGLPQLLLSTQGSMTNLASFVAIELGWDSRGTDLATFWFLNTGLFIPLLALGFLEYGGRQSRHRSLILFTVAFLPWFVIPNVLRLAPWIWDNNKVLFYWFVGCVPVVSLLLARLIRRRGAVRAAGLAAVLVLCLSGGIDVWRAVSGQTEYGEFDRDGIAIAEEIRSITSPTAVILHAPTWNVPVYLTGRRSVLGYPGHVWSRGLPYVDREAAVKQIYAGGAEAVQLLAQFRVAYILVSPIERGALAVNDTFFSTMKLVAQAGAYRLYEAPHP